MDSHKLAWLAGILDGEGTIGVYVSQGWIKKEMRIVNTSESIIVEANRIITGLVGHSVGIEMDKRPSNKAKHVCYAVGVYRQRDFIVVLESLLPYLIAKKAQAEVMLSLCKSHKFRTRYTKTELQVIDVLKRMKKEGMTPVPGNTEGSRSSLGGVDPVETVNLSDPVPTTARRDSDSIPESIPNLRCYNTLSNRLIEQIEGIVQPLSNEVTEQDRSSRVRSN